jgi:hypothetical protein
VEGEVAVYLGPPEEPTRLRGWLSRRTPYFWLYGICGVVFGAFLITNLPELMRPYSIIHERAAPYAWPPQCRERQIEKGDDVEFGCVREEYRFNDQNKKLLISFRGRTVYYRIGNDLVGLACGSKDCIASYVMRDAYYQ